MFTDLIRRYRINSQRRSQQAIHSESELFCYIHDYNGIPCVCVSGVPVYSIGKTTELDKCILSLDDAHAFLSHVRSLYAKTTTRSRAF